MYVCMYFVPRGISLGASILSLVERATEYTPGLSRMGHPRSANIQSILMVIYIGVMVFGDFQVTLDCSINQKLPANLCLCLLYLPSNKRCNFVLFTEVVEL